VIGQSCDRNEDAESLIYPALQGLHGGVSSRGEVQRRAVATGGAHWAVVRNSCPSGSWTFLVQQVSKRRPAGAGER
jgi:hypothetical protein